MLSWILNFTQRKIRWSKNGSRPVSTKTWFFSTFHFRILAATSRLNGGPNYNWAAFRIQGNTGEKKREERVSSLRWRDVASVLVPRTNLVVVAVAFFSIRPAESCQLPKWTWPKVVDVIWPIWSSNPGRLLLQFSSDTISYWGAESGR